MEPLYKRGLLTQVDDRSSNAAENSERARTNAAEIVPPDWATEREGRHVAGLGLGHVELDLTFVKYMCECFGVKGLNHEPDMWRKQGGQGWTQGVYRIYD